MNLYSKIPLKISISLICIFLISSLHAEEQKPKNLQKQTSPHYQGPMEVIIVDDGEVPISNLFWCRLLL